MIDKIQIRLFGEFHMVAADGRTLRVPLRRVAALLAYLATSPGEVFARERLASLLWGRSEPHLARQSLRQVLSKLAQLFESTGVDLLSTSKGTVLIDRSALMVDALEFETLVADGAPAALARATALYTSEFLTDLTLDSPEFDDWLMETRGRYHDMAVQSLVVLLERNCRSGHIESAIGAAQSVLRLDPCREDIHRRLMRLYDANGMRPSALGQYGACQGALERELGVRPDQETRALYARIRGREPSILRSGAATEDGSIFRSGAATEDGSTLSSGSPPLAAGNGDARNPGEASERHLLGRDQELRVLDQSAVAVSLGKTRFLALIGETGVGKSCLVERFVSDVAARGMATITMRASRTEQALVLTPWLDLMNGRLPGQSDQVGPGKVSLVRGAAGIPDGARKELRGRVEARGIGRHRFYGAVLDRLRAGAKAQPLILVFDDLQWADDESLRLLFYLVRRLGRARVLVVGVVRSESLSETSFLATMLRDLEREKLRDLIVLKPLSRNETARLYEKLLETHGQARGGKIRRDELWALCEGNPGMITEAVLARTRGGELRQSGSGGHLTALADELPDRIESLSRRARKAVSVASVFGSRVDVDLLGRTTGLKRDEVVEAVEELTAAGVLAVHGEGLIFVHERVRRRLYRDQIPARRRALHMAIARAMKRRAANGLELNELTLAEHLRMAGQIFVAAEHQVNGALAALRRGRGETAGKHLHQALKTVRSMPVEDRVLRLEVTIHLGLAALAEAGGNLDKAARSLAAAELRFDRVKDPRTRAATLRALSRIHHRTGDVEAAFAYGRRAMMESEQRGQNGLWSPADRLFAQIHLVDGGLDSFGDDLDRERHRCRARGLLLDEAEAAAALGLLRAAQGKFAQAQAELKASIRIAKGLASQGCLAACHQARGMVLAWQGDADAALSNLRTADRIAATHGDIFRLYSLHGHRGFALSLAERHREAVIELELAIAMADRLRVRIFRPLFMTWLADAWIDLGDDAAALKVGRAAFRMAAETNQPWAVSVALRAIARALAQPAFSDRGGAYKAVTWALEIQQRLGLRVERARSLYLHAKILREFGDLGRSSEIYGQACEMFEHMHMIADSDRARTMADALRPAREIKPR